MSVKYNSRNSVSVIVGNIQTSLRGLLRGTLSCVESCSWNMQSNQHIVCLLFIRFGWTIPLRQNTSTGRNGLCALNFHITFKHLTDLIPCCIFALLKVTTLKCFVMNCSTDSCIYTMLYIITHHLDLLPPMWPLPYRWSLTCDPDLS